jgi:hypothetical protein
MFGTYGTGHGSWDREDAFRGAFASAFGGAPQPSGPLTPEDVKETCRHFCEQSKQAGITMRFDRGPEGVRLLVNVIGRKTVGFPWRRTPAGALWIACQEFHFAKK